MSLGNRCKLNDKLFKLNVPNCMNKYYLRSNIYFHPTVIV